MRQTTGNTRKAKRRKRIGAAGAGGIRNPLKDVLRRCAPECFLPENRHHRFEIVRGLQGRQAMADRARDPPRNHPRTGRDTGPAGRFPPGTDPDGVGNDMLVRLSLTDMNGNPSPSMPAGVFATCLLHRTAG